MNNDKLASFRNEDRTPVKESRSNYNLKNKIMKTLILRKYLPIAVVAIGIGGAFATTSMQSASKAAPKDGFTRNSSNKCTAIQVECSDVDSGTMCRVSYPSGAIAYDKVANNNCLQPLYRPN